MGEKTKQPHSMYRQWLSQFNTILRHRALRCPLCSPTPEFGSDLDYDPLSLHCITMPLQFIAPRAPAEAARLPRPSVHQLGVRRQFKREEEDA